MSENDPQAYADLVHEQQHRALKKGVVGLGVGIAAGIEHERDPRQFWSIVRWLYVVISFFWVAGAFDAALSSGERAVQGILGGIGMVMGAWMVLTRWATRRLDRVDPERTGTGQ